MTAKQNIDPLQQFVQENAGTGLDLDPEIEKAGIECWEANVPPEPEG